MKVCKPIIFKSSNFSRDSVATYWGDDKKLHTAMPNFLRYGYDPYTGNPVGVIIEDASTNVFTRSNDFSHSDWVKDDGVTIEDSAEIAPDGGFAQYISSDTLNAGIESDVAGGGVVSVSICAKYRSVIGFFVIEGVGAGAMFDPVDGAIMGGSGASVQRLDNGWYRFSVTGMRTGPIRFYCQSGAYELYVAMAQFEVGSVSSYIETDDVPMERVADAFDETPPRVVTSNVSEEDADQWEDDEPYSAGDIVMVLGEYHRIYESVGSNTDKFPPDNPEEWIDQGPTNRWRMFDMATGPEKQTVSDALDNTIRVVIEADQIVSSLTLLNIEAKTLRVTVSSTSGELLYQHDEGLLQNSYEASWWSFFFGTRKTKKIVTLTDLPSSTPVTIEMVLDGGEFPAKLGKYIVGEGIEIGCARYGTGLGMLDFSTKGRDAFGNSYIVERRFVNDIDFDIRVLTSQIDDVYDLLTSLRAMNAVYIGHEDYKTTVVYGHPTAIRVVLSGPKYTDLSLQVESI